MNTWKRYLCMVSGMAGVLLVTVYLYFYTQPKYVWKPEPENTSTFYSLLNTKQTFFHKIKSILQKDCAKTIKRPETSDSEFVNDVWHVMSGHTIPSGGLIMIFRAYFDARQNLPAETIRILGVSTNLQEAVYCQLWFSNFSQPLIIKADAVDTGRGLGVGKKHYQERLYSCSLPHKLNIPPRSVSLTFTQCENASNIIPIYFPTPIQVHEFGVCVVVAYGILDSISLVEWIEFNRLLGVKEFNIYDSRIDDKSRAVFQHYRNEGILHLYKSAPPMQGYWCKWCQKLAVIPALNDCMYRNMFRYKHLVVIDFDEVIVPQKLPNLSVLISQLRPMWSKEPAAYMFRNAYFFKDFSPDLKAPAYLTTVKYLKRTEVSRYGYAPKSIVNPRRCIIMQNHYCMVKTPDVPKSGLRLDVKPIYALSHHYKDCHFKKEECLKYLKNPIQDNSVLQFSQALNVSVYEKLTELKLLK